MIMLSAEEIAKRMLDLQLVENLQMQEIWSDLRGRDVTAEELLQAMVRRDMLTNWQVERIKRDDTTGFFYGEYKVIYLAGAGTFSRVYRATHKHTGQMAAVKVLRHRHSDNPEMTGKFMHEAEMGMQLRHPNIVPVHDVDHVRDTFWLVMDFIEGNTLRDFIKLRKVIEPMEATRMMIDILGALRYAAQQGIAHKDIKASNVLISSRGEPKLIDFGLASVEGDDRFHQRTVDYAGLEKACGAPKNDPRSDLYFLGCVFYHMLAGEPPLLETRDRAERSAKIRFLDVTPLHIYNKDVPRSVARVVGRSMELNPENRYQTPAEMLVDLKVAGDRITEQTERRAAAAGAPAEASIGARVVMVVESNLDMQNTIRLGLKRSGYRVLLTSSPDRALDRLVEDNKTADCVILNAGSLGAKALEIFNRFGEEEPVKDVPAVLLLDPAQHQWHDQANVSPHRVLLPMPLKLKELRMVLARLLESKTAAP